MASGTWATSPEAIAHNSAKRLRRRSPGRDPDRNEAVTSRKFFGSVDNDPRNCAQGAASTRGIHVLGAAGDDPAWMHSCPTSCATTSARCDSLPTSLANIVPLLHAT